MDKAYGDLRDVIAEDQQAHAPQRRAQKHPQKGQRHPHQPDGSGVQQAGEQGVAAGAEDAHHQGHAVRAQRQLQRLEDKQHPGQGQRLGGHLVQRQKQRVDGNGDEPRQQAGKGQQEGETVAVIDGALPVVLSHKAPDEDTAGIAEAPGKDEQQLNGCVGDLHRRQRCGAQQAVGHGI